ncbi:MAG: sugar-binding domain-containing protein, partial [Pyrinomonadaceae bacterium]
MIIAFFIVFASILSTAGQGRVTKSFDNDWLFFKGDVAGSEKSDVADSAWRKLNVPHDWSIEGPFDAKNPTAGSGGFLPAGVGWYRKHFTVPVTQKDKRVFVEFDGVMANSDVWINGVHLGKRPMGYVSFGYELTRHLNFGKDNVIAVRADNAGQPASRWYTGAGIYRHVRLLVADAVHIEKWSTFVTTPTVSEAEGAVKVSSRVINQSTAAKAVALDVKLLDPSGKLVGRTANKSSDIAANGSSDFNFEIKVPNPQRWNLESPYLYKAVVTVMSNGKTIDSETVTFGIRAFEFVPATGFWLNGKNFKLKGACLHHDGSAFGAAVPIAVWER